MLERYEINNLEQLRAIADVLRLRIIDMLQEHPMTVTQLGEALGIAPAKVHYHVRELEKVGLLQLVETREKGGILEKYYQPIARDISVSNDLFMSAPSNESLAATSAWLDQMKEDFQRAFRTALEEKKAEKSFLILGSVRLYVTEEEHKALAKQLIDMLKPYENRRGIEGEQSTALFIVGYPQPSPQDMPQPRGAIATKNAWVVGSVSYSRQDLEKAVAEGRRLDINVTGVCHFDDDISPELADQAIGQFNLVGKLEAPPEVREVLLKKSSGSLMNFDTRTG